MELIVALFSLVLTNNLLMSGVKWLAETSATKPLLRSLLVLFSLLGIVSTAALNGNPIDFNQFSELGRTLLETIAVALASHFSYKAIKNA